MSRIRNIMWEISGKPNDVISPPGHQRMGIMLDDQSSVLCGSRDPGKQSMSGSLIIFIIAFIFNPQS